MGETIALGGMPYVDAAFNKGPLTALLFGVFDPLVGSSTTAVRLTVVPFAAVTALALAAWVAHHAGRAAGALAGLTFAALSAVGALEGAEGKTEQYGLAPVFGALWLATRGSPAAAAGAGALMVCALLINPAHGIAVPVLLVQLWLATPPSGRARRLAVSAAGALAPTVLVCGWLAAGGALDDMVTQVGGGVLDALRDEDPPYTGPIRPAAFFGAPIAGVWGRVAELPLGGLWLLGLLGCAAAMRAPRLRWPAGALAFLIVATIARVSVPLYELDYQYYLALPATCGGIALGIASLWPPRRADRIAVAALVLAYPLWVLAIHPQLQALRQTPEERAPYGAAALPVADFVRARTAPDDPIVVAGGRAEVYWVAGRRAPTRFFDGFGELGDPDYPAQRLRDLTHRPPTAIVVMNTDPRPERVIQQVLDSGRYSTAYDRAGSTVWLRRGQ